MNILLLSLLSLCLIFCVVIILAIVMGGPVKPPLLVSISDPFATVDYSTMPTVDFYTARDGARLSFRQYGIVNSPTHKVAVLVHGSSANCISMHLLAQGFARQGYMTYALDMRGHGESVNDSGHKDQIDYIGQLEDDLVDFRKTIPASKKVSLIGFSSGAGFALRFAGSAQQRLFDNYLCLSPFLHQSADTVRRDGGGWVSIGVPRWVALSLLTNMGMTRFNDLPVMAFAIGSEGQRGNLTELYSFALAQNFRPQQDYRKNIGAVKQPMAVLVGQDDELFIADRFSDEFRQAKHPVSVSIIPGCDHIDMILRPEAIDAAVTAVTRMNLRVNQ